MTSDLRLRRHLYEQAAAGGRRHRRMLRKQIALLSGGRGPGSDGGPAGVREPRRPRPPRSPAAAPRP